MPPYRSDISSILASATQLGDDRLTAGGNDGALYILDTNSGGCHAQAAFRAPISAPVTKVDGGFCVGTLDGRLCRYVGGD